MSPVSPGGSCCCGGWFCSAIGSPHFSAGVGVTRAVSAQPSRRMATLGHASSPHVASCARIAASPGVRSDDDREAETGVVGRVPRHVRERGEREPRQPSAFRPLADVVDERPADATPRMSRVDGHLLDVRVPVDLVGQHVRHRRVAQHPRPARPLVGGQCLDRRRLVVRDRRHADIAERLARRAFDVAENRQVGRTGLADHGLSVSGPLQRHRQPRPPELRVHHLPDLRRTLRDHHASRLAARCRRRPPRHRHRDRPGHPRPLRPPDQRQHHPLLDQTADASSRAPGSPRHRPGAAARGVLTADHQ